MPAYLIQRRELNGWVIARNRRGEYAAILDKAKADEAVRCLGPDFRVYEMSEAEWHAYVDTN
jgi:hypothetical protein